MTKQAQIRGGIAKLTEDRFRQPAESLQWDKNFNSMLAQNIMEYLHSQGVVIRTDVIGEAPQTFIKCDDGYYNLIVAVEPLI